MTSRRTFLHLLRHADAGDPLAWAGPDDLRPLSARGEEQAERVGAFLAASAVRPGAIVSSPRARALRTAEIVGAALGVAVRVDPVLADEPGAKEIEALRVRAGVEDPLLVGHDPWISLLVADLCEAPGVRLAKGMLASVELRGAVRGGDGRLRLLVTPELLRPR